MKNERNNPWYLSLAAVAALASACSSEPQKTETPAPVAAPKPKTPAERVARYRECWAYFNTAAYDPFRSCYADTIVSEAMGSGRPALRGTDAVLADDKEMRAAFPDMAGALQLILAKEGTIVGIAQMNGTHGGPLSGPGAAPIAATNKPVGYLMAHVIEWDAMGQSVTTERSYSDSATMLAQLGLNPAPARPVTPKSTIEPTVAIAAGTDMESKNLEAFRAQTDAFNKHDMKGVDSYNAPGAVFHDLTAPKDTDAKGNAKTLNTFWRAFPDATLMTPTLWAAGDYVVAEGTFEGTNNGVAPAMGITKATKKSVKVPFFEVTRYEGAKVKDDWLIFESMAFAQQLGLVAPPK